LKFQALPLVNSYSNCPKEQLLASPQVLEWQKGVSSVGNGEDDEGFSPVSRSLRCLDFHAMTTVDPALMSSSNADKSHREYVWVFQFAKGGFRPETFSWHRPYQFTKVETNSLGSKAGPKVVEDAFCFVEATNR
jgi:hypothetical protein